MSTLRVCVFMETLCVLFNKDAKAQGLGEMKKKNMIELKQ